MRLSPPISVVSIVALALTAVSVGQQRNADRRDVRCIVAAAYLNHVFTETYLASTQNRIVISSEPENIEMFGNSDDIAALKSGKAALAVRKHPFFDLYLQAARQSDESPTKLCPEVGEFLRRADISPRIAGDQNTPNPPDKDGIFKYQIIRLSLPAVDVKRGEAIMFASQTSALLGAGGFEIYLRRNSFGEWVVLYQQTRWVS